jgi:hypothetical protein
MASILLSKHIKILIQGYFSVSSLKSYVRKKIVSKAYEMPCNAYYIGKNEKYFLYTYDNFLEPSLSLSYVAVTAMKDTFIFITWTISRLNSDKFQKHFDFGAIVK